MQQKSNPFDKNTLLAFVLMGFLLLGYMYLNKPSEEQLEAQRLERIEADKTAAEAAATQQAEIPEPMAETPEDSVSLTVVASDYEVENPKFKVNFSGKGGYISELLLKNYSAFDEEAEDNKRPLYLIQKGYNEFGLKFKDKSGQIINTAELPFEPSVQKSDSVTVVTMTAPLSGAKLQYIYTVGTGNTIDFEIKSQGIHQVSSSNEMEVGWTHSAFSIEKGRQQEEYWSQTYYRFKGTNDVEYKLFGSDNWNEKKDVDWIAFKQQFFTSILSFNDGFPMPEGGSDRPGEKADSSIVKEYHFASNVPVVGSEIDYRMQWHFVPLDYKLLSKGDYRNKDFHKAVPFGWSFLGWLNRHFFLNIFQWLAKFGIGYGWVIFLMTIVVKLVLSPVMYKQYRQSAMMRVLRPEINEINEKFKGKDNAMKRQQATMELYRKAGANPLSGCLPAVLQIPIFYALFRFFPNIIDLRGKSFLWAEDLTAYDSLVTLPKWVPFMEGHLSIFALAYVIAMVVYFKVSGSMDNFNQPRQEGMPDMSMMKYMMYVMPLFFFVFLNNYASGLSWYYLVSNIINIGIVFVIKNVMINDEKIHAKIQENKKKPKKKSRWGAKMQELMEQAQEQQKLQEKNKKGKK